MLINLFRNHVTYSSYFLFSERLAILPAMLTFAADRMHVAV